MGEDEQVSNRGSTNASGKTLIVTYRVDAKDRIEAVGGGWDRFAEENGAEELSQGAVLGLQLRSFLSGDVTRMYVDSMLSKARRTGQAFSLNYRCDSPERKRIFEMTLEACEGSVLSTHRLLCESALTLPLFSNGDSLPSDDAPVLRRCSICNRLSTRDGEYIEPEDWPADEQRHLKVIHNVCKPCQSRVGQWQRQPKS